MESTSRSFAKALSYRILGSATTALVCYLLAGKAGLSMGAGALDMVAKIGLYFLHERVWNYVAFGRDKRPEYEI
jgi:adenylylsulfate kinase